jgi:S-(hydroxymethyl)glutathione dehydrogenase/alcohol dehydrogenase
VLTGVGAVLNRARVRPGDTAAVFGVGGVGLNVIQGLRLAGATRIVGVDTVADKEALGRRFGATDFVLAHDGAGGGDTAASVRALLPPDPERASGALAPGGGVTWSFDCVGHPTVLRSALDVLDWGGTALAIGIPARGTEVSLDMNALATVDRGVLGCRYGSARPQHDIPLLVELYRSGSLLLDELVSLTRPLAAFSEVVAAMHAGRVARGVLTFG